MKTGKGQKGLKGRKGRMTLAMLALALASGGCDAVRSYRIWTAPEPSDGYAIGTAREIPPPYRTLEAGDFPIDIPSEYRKKR